MADKSQIMASDSPGLEKVEQPIYDTITLKATTNGVITFFRDVQGKGKYQTFLQTAGQLSKNNIFKLHGIAFKLITPSVILADMEKIFLTSKPQVTFLMENKAKLELPMDEFPSGVQIHPYFDSASAGTKTLAANGFDSIANVFHFKNPITIESLMSFQVDVNFAAALGISGDIDMRCKLIGTLYRPAR
jgi:hypothetical protein